MKTSVISLSPIHRTSWRCVPSPQSNSRRSPPRRTSSAGRPRRAVGAEPAVPAKKTDRSMVRLAPSVVVALLAVVLALPGTAAAAGGPQAGVVLDSLDGHDLSVVRRARVKLVRMFLFAHDYRPGIVPQVIDRLAAVGARPLFVVVGDTKNPPTTPEAVDAFARFAGGLAAEGRGRVAGWEIWNEQDAPEWWAGAPPVDGVAKDATAYTALLRASASAVRRADPRAPVILAGLTGNDFRFLADVYRHGGRGAFDAVAVHTDTACNLGGPAGYLRDLDGRINQFSFLAYREVRRTMVANGDARRNIWMTELGWSTTTATCPSGRFAGQKAGGVSEADQAKYTTEALHCLRLARYVTHAFVFKLRDQAPETMEARYGLVRPDGAPKPAWDRFTRYVRRGDRLTGSCGDFTAPRITIGLPRRGQRFPKNLRISVRASDGSGVPRITLLIDGRKIRNFTDARAPRTARGFIDWQGAKRLRVGRHVITVLALDRYRNTSRRAVRVVKTPRG